MTSCHGGLGEGAEPPPQSPRPLSPTPEGRFPRAAAACLLLAALLSATFAAGAITAGKTSPPASIAIGSGWVFTLALIVSAPLLVPRLRREATEAGR